MLRCLTLWQPWASLIAVGAKSIETRGWYTSFRGEIAIHAAKAFPKEAKDIACTPEFIRRLRENRADQFYAWQVLDGLPLGAIVAVATLESVVRTTKIAGRIYAGPVTVPYTELPFGDFTEGRYAWVLSDIRRLPSPVPAKGGRMLWLAQQHIEAAVRAQLRDSSPLVRTCRACGCTDRDCRRCIERTGAPCYWVAPDLCSACAGAGVPHA